ncbi:Snaclec 3 [Exaiptasia diaphana]|nr:Snaclec 3 [Exaiptasia diaphana]
MHDNKTVPCKLKNLPEELTNIFFTDLGNGWFRYGKAAIKLFTERKNWTDARSHCQSLGGDLLSITSSHENDFVHDVFVENLNLTFLQDLGNGWFRYGDSAIKVFTEKKNWTDARSHCQSLGGDLLSITSSHENDFVNEIFVDNLNVTYIQEDKKINLPYRHFKLNGDESQVRLLGVKGDAEYKLDGREKALYLNGKTGEAEIPSTSINPDGFTLFFWIKPLEPYLSAFVFGLFKDSSNVLKLGFKSSHSA